jgi:hypothetical protein
LEESKSARLSNDYQGFYIYREDRLIHGPDWLGMFRSEPHFTLCRVEFSFDHNLDDAFHIDIKKSQIILNEDLYNMLRDEFLPAPRRAAEQSYRTGLKRKSHGAAKEAHDASNVNIHGKAAELATAKIDSVDAAAGKATITNKLGTTTIRIPSSKPKRPGQLHVEPVADINDGLLWQPCLIEKNVAVRINTGHPYYQKVYLPNHKSDVLIEGMDALLWALSGAELGTISAATQRQLEELRYEVSKQLRTLVEDLPEPELSDSNE